jgi:hypothetical protein
MKKYYYILAACFAFLLYFPLANAAFAAETKKVCIDKMKDGKPVLDKAGKPVQDCKEVKQHKKLEGTKVEDVKKETPKK